jgi:hypothetical protein
MERPVETLDGFLERNRRTSPPTPEQARRLAQIVASAPHTPTPVGRSDAA